jgi:hypothetical protein
MRSFRTPLLLQALEVFLERHVADADRRDGAHGGPITRVQRGTHTSAQDLVEASCRHFLCVASCRQTCAPLIAVAPVHPSALHAPAEVVVQALEDATV